MTAVAAAAERKAQAEVAAAAAAAAEKELQVQTVAAVHKAYAPRRINLPAKWTGKEGISAEIWLSDLFLACSKNVQDAQAALRTNVSVEVRNAWHALLTSYGRDLTWDETVTEFVRLNGGDAEELGAQALIDLLSHTVVQGSLPYREYVQLFRGKAIAAGAQRISVPTLILLFITGLIPALASACAKDPLGKDWESLEELITYGHGQASRLPAKAGKAAKLGAVGGVHKVVGKKGGRGQQGRQALTNALPGPPGVQNGSCHLCKTPGHFANGCQGHHLDNQLPFPQALYQYMFKQRQESLARQAKGGKGGGSGKA
jgi:hypothetical protein